MKKVFKRISGQFVFWGIGFAMIWKTLGIEYAILYIGATIHVLATAILVCIMISKFEVLKKEK